MIRRAVGLALGLACLGLVGACSTAAPPDLARRTVPPPATADPARPCTREALPGPAAGPPAGPVTATFDRAAKVIRLTQGHDVTLRALRAAAGTDAALRETAPGEWLLGASLEVDRGASVRIAAPDVRWLKLRSVPGSFAAVKAFGGGVTVTGACVTSWDDGAGRADTDPQHGRGFLLARDGAAMTVDHAELAFLGYGERESYGLSWRTEGTTGRLTDSIVSHDYFGVYSYDVGGLVITRNDVHDNLLYGIDPHTGSHDLRIADNTVHDNGKHGIILAENCVHSVISGNVVYRNQHHGIVLYQHSDQNTVENNESFANAAQGVNVNESEGNTIAHNRVYDNQESGIGIAQIGRDTTLTGNDVRGNKVDGVRLVSASTATTLRDNMIGQNGRYGVYVDSDGPFSLAGNTIWANRTGVQVRGAAPPSPAGNSIFGNRLSDVTGS